MQDASGAGRFESARFARPEDIPWAPQARLLHLLTEASSTLGLVSASSYSPEFAKARSLVAEAASIVGGFDAYLAQCSSPTPTIVEKMWKQGNECDWEKLYQQGRTAFRFVPIMSAGPYEGLVLQQLAKLNNVSSSASCRLYSTTSDLLTRQKTSLK